jgi:hypothetical protein
LSEQWEELEAAIDYQVVGPIGVQKIRDEMVLFRKTLDRFLTWQKDIGLAPTECKRLHYHCQKAHVQEMNQKPGPILYECEPCKVVVIDNVHNK